MFFGWRQRVKCEGGINTLLPSGQYGQPSNWTIQLYLRHTENKWLAWATWDPDPHGGHGEERGGLGLYLCGLWPSQERCQKSGLHCLPSPWAPQNHKASVLSCPSYSFVNIPKNMYKYRREQETQRQREEAHPPDTHTHHTSGLPI